MSKALGSFRVTVLKLKESEEDTQEVVDSFRRLVKATEKAEQEVAESNKQLEGLTSKQGRLLIMSDEELLNAKTDEYVH
jgi:hypothetical protein